MQPMALGCAIRGSFGVSDSVVQASVTTSLSVWRGSAQEEGRVEIYEVPFEEGMSVLDALRWIRTHVDPSLAIRYSCINANACHTCIALVDGAVEYTCTARLSSAGASVAPLPKRAVVRDLVTDTVPADEKLNFDA
jgi:succinate dehydrogenase/fumarate reductase-like Fe-S protein